MSASDSVFTTSHPHQAVHHRALTSQDTAAVVSNASTDPVYATHPPTSRLRQRKTF